MGFVAVWLQDLRFLSAAPRAGSAAAGGRLMSQVLTITGDIFKPRPMRQKEPPPHLVDLHVCRRQKMNATQLAEHTLHLAVTYPVLLLRVRQWEHADIAHQKKVQRTQQARLQRHRHREQQARSSSAVVIPDSEGEAAMATDVEPSNTETGSEAVASGTDTPGPGKPRLPVRRNGGNTDWPYLVMED